MKRFLINILLFIPLFTLAQDFLIKDLDNDKMNDSIIYNRKYSLIICKLSSQNFNKNQSEKIQFVNSESSGIQMTKSGFEFYNYQMREGYTCQFRFEKATEKIQLIGMTRYNNGNAELDGSGESSVNLLTKRYGGNWNYFDKKKIKLIKIATINEKYTIPKTYLNEFSEKQPEEYRIKCDKFYLKHKKTTANRRLAQAGF